MKKFAVDKTSVSTQKKQNKYKNKRITVDGITYDSKNEYERHLELLLLEKAGVIKCLEFHNKDNNITLIDNPAVRYEPDFCYIENDVNIVEDMKGFQTAEFILKKKIIISKILKEELDITFRLTKRTNGKTITIEEYNL